MTSQTFADLGLPEQLVRALDDAGFTTPTPIQGKAIPAQLQGRDILGIAQTGSGKTAAFGLPIIAGLLEEQGKPAPKTARALILAPTRELAVQIEEMMRMYARGRRISTALVLGGVSRHGQIQKLARGVDVLIATPGRLQDLMDDRKVRLDQTKWLVLDEADRMLDMGFIQPVRQIAKAVGHDRKTALFSATMAPEIAKLAASLLNDPVRVEAAPQGSTVAKIDQRVILSTAKKKRDVLNELLADESLSRIILFTRTKHGADKVAKNLSIDGHANAAIHGNKSQNARQAALRGFRDGRVRILVATDIAARGIDVPDISHVINYELPDDAENYVHRIGRTGRNGASGAAITLVDGTERSKLRGIERLIRRTLPVSGELPAGEPTSKPKSQGRRRPNQGGPKRFKSGGGRPPRRGNADGPVGNNRKPWQTPTDAEAPKPEGAKSGKPARGKKPRWNKRKKDMAKSDGNKPRRYSNNADAA